MPDKPESPPNISLFRLIVLNIVTAGLAIPVGYFIGDAFTKAYGNNVFSWGMVTFLAVSAGSAIGFLMAKLK